MVPVRFDPFAEFRELDRRLRALAPFGGEEKSNISAFAPAVNTREDDKSFIVEVDVPGVPQEAIEVDLHDGLLVISGERKEEKEEKKEGYYRKESFFGKFERSFSLPDGVEADKISAANKDGVLTITLPKSAPKPRKQISVK